MSRFALIAVSVLVASLGALLIAAPQPVPRFVNRSAGSGIQVELKNDESENKHLIETMTGGLALIDFNNDGLLDLFFVNGAKIPSLEKPNATWWNRLYRNKGNWQFEDVTGKAAVAGKGYSMGAATADYDGDGFPDLFVTGVRGNTLYRNRGDGTFEDVTAKSGVKAQSGAEIWAVSAGWFDYDRDGDLDLFIANYVRWNPATESRCGDLLRKVPTYCHPKLYEGTPNQLFRNNGDSTFTDVSAESGIAKSIGKGMGLSIADIDGDGWQDVFVGNDTVPNFLFWNNGDGTFREQAFEAGVALNDDGMALSSMGADLKDLDNDGLPDIFFSALANETWPLFRNLGDRIFAEITYPSGIGKATLPHSGWSVGVHDFNNDGWKDLFVAGGDVNTNTEKYSSRKSRQPNRLLLNGLGESFEDVTVPAGLEAASVAWHRGTAFGDLNGDGCMDVVLTRLHQSPLLLENRCHQETGGNKTNWVGFDLRQAGRNRKAIGATITLHLAGGRKIVNAVLGASGYLSASDTRVHFGLGASAAIGKVVIRWPDGSTEEREAPAINQWVRWTRAE